MLNFGLWCSVGSTPVFDPIRHVHICDTIKGNESYVGNIQF